MATHIDGSAVRTFNFASAISAYRFVEIHTDGTARPAVSGSSRAIGSTIADVATGDNGAVKLFYPTFFATCETAIAIGGLVATTGSGLVTTAAANVGVVGVALEAGAADAVVEVAVPLTQ
jgi:hypothetical protein